MAKQRFRKGTVGYNGEAFVIPAVAVSAAANYKAFCEATGPDGQLAVFNASTNALITTALAEGDEFYVAQRRSSVDSDGSIGVHKSSPYIFSKKGVFGIDYVAPVKDSKTITFPSYTPKAGDELSIKVIETADNSHVPPQFTFVYKVKAGDTLQKIYEGLAERITKFPKAVGIGDDVFVSATGGANGLVITHLFEQASFKVATPGLSFDYAVITPTTPAVYGSGYYDEVAQIEYEAATFDGINTQFPGDGFVPSDFPTGKLFATVGTQYAKIQLNSYKEEYSPTPVNKHHHLKHLTLIPVQAGASHTQLQIIFNLAVAG